MNGTVFVIDDDASARQSMRALLTTLRFSCREFDAAESFLENYDAATPGCVLCDLRLQGMSGLELLDILDRNAATTPVILVTAFAKTPLTVRAMRRGAVNVLDKPIDEDQLWEAVREALNLDAKRREKRTIRGSDVAKDRSRNTGVL